MTIPDLLTIFIILLLTGTVVFGIHAFKLEIQGLINHSKLILKEISDEKLDSLIDNSKNIDLEISSEECIGALNSLINFLEKEKPDYIVGIHPGGQIISAYIAAKMVYGNERWGFANTEPARLPKMSISFPPPSENKNYISGRKVVFIDDISRSGRTLSLVEKCFRLMLLKNLIKFREAKFTVLIEAVKKGEKGIDRFKTPDWFYYRTTYKELKLPWSFLSDQIKLAYEERQNQGDFDQNFIDFHEKLTSDFNFAIHVANQIIEKSIKINCETIISDYQKITEQTKSRTS